MLANKTVFSISAAIRRLCSADNLIKYFVDGYPIRYHSGNSWSVTIKQTIEIMDDTVKKFLLIVGKIGF